MVAAALLPACSGGSSWGDDAGTSGDTDDMGDIKGTVYMDWSTDGNPDYQPQGGIEVSAVDQDSESYGPATSETGTGAYLLPVPSGTYTVTAKSEWDPVSHPGIAVEPGDSVVLDFNLNAGVDAPYIYLYPEEAMQVGVTLDPADGTCITASEPDYGDGWSVLAEPSGLLDGTWDFLFYEAEVNWVFQQQQGWAVPAAEIWGWLEGALPAMGLSSAETQDFLDYWTLNLPEAPCYLVYPQPKETIGATMGLDITPAPDSLLRLWLVIDGADECAAPPPPTVAPFTRQGFTAVEWGVVLGVFVS
jgi:hypothetical protein